MGEKITLDAFISLPDQEQFGVIFTIGEILEVRPEENKRFVLYAVDRFLVELEYDNEIGKIVNKKTFITGKILNKYSTNINRFLLLARQKHYKEQGND